MTDAVAREVLSGMVPVYTLGMQVAGYPPEAYASRCVEFMVWRLRAHGREPTPELLEAVWGLVQQRSTTPYTLPPVEASALRTLAPALTTTPLQRPPWYFGAALAGETPKPITPVASLSMQDITYGPR